MGEGQGSFAGEDRYLAIMAGTVVKVAFVRHFGGCRMFLILETKGI